MSKPGYRCVFGVHYVDRAAAATVDDCAHVWMAFRRWRIPTAILNSIPKTVSECQKMCEVNGSCVSVDFNVQGQCFMSLFGPEYGNNTDDPPGTKEPSFINYKLQRTCPSGTYFVTCTVHVLGCRNMLYCINIAYTMITQP